MLPVSIWAWWSLAPIQGSNTVGHAGVVHGMLYPCRYWGNTVGVVDIASVAEDPKSLLMQLK